jgi:hypothetical protein
MNRLLGILLLSAFSIPALAADPPNVKAPHAHHPRVTWEAHFAQANLAHDGHLTLEEAKGGDTLVARHFADIDATHRGYVTEDDVRAWRASWKAAHPRSRTAHRAKRTKTLASRSESPAPTPAGATGTPPASPVQPAGQAPAADKN